MPASEFALFWSDYLKGNAGLVARLNTWMNEDGLTVAEAEAAMRKLMRPGEASKLEYTGKVLAVLAGAVDIVIRDRKAREDQDRRRADAEAAKNNTASPAAIKQILADRMKVPV